MTSRVDDYARDRIYEDYLREHKIDEQAAMSADEFFQYQMDRLTKLLTPETRQSYSIALGVQIGFILGMIVTDKKQREIKAWIAAGCPDPAPFSKTATIDGDGDRFDSY